MSSLSAHVGMRTMSVSRISYGIVGGLLGGVVFGVLMQAVDMMPMVAMLVSSESIAVGWVVHLAISAFIGASFAVLAHRSGVGTLVALGIGYGIVWWVLGALILMPARLGMDIFTFNTTAWQSLMGHVLFGGVLGVVFAMLVRRSAD